MKALDTPVMLAILHGDRSARELLRRLRGLEVATTELNLLELDCLARRGTSGARASRHEALGRLRRSLTVLPFDSKAAEGVARRTARSKVEGYSPLGLATLATLEANGCDEFITIDPQSFPGRWQFQISKLK